MPKFNQCDMRKFATGGRCIIEVDSDDPKKRGFWFGEIVCMHIIVDAYGSSPPEITARIKGGRLNALGIPSPDPDIDGIPTCEHTIYPYDDTMVEVLSRLGSLQKKYEDDTSSLETRLHRAENLNRQAERMHADHFCQLLDAQEKLKTMERSATVPSYPIIQVSNGRDHRDEAPKAASKVVDGPGCYSMVSRGPALQEA